MNNAQFRKLLETPRSERAPPANGTTSATPLLGSRQRSSMPMTPRSVTTQSDFARQVAAHNAALNPKPTRKFRSSAAPLGTTLPTGYVDRAKTRDSDALDERDIRLQALAELAKEGKIDREEYVRQTKLLGGDVKSTHLVKGLDYKLLEKVRRGEDVMEGEKEDEEEKEKEDEDMEERLEKALESEVVPVEKEKREKKGVQAAPVPKTRAEILAALKESRRAAKEAAQPSLGAKFKKIGEPKMKEKEKPKEPEEKVKYVTLPDGRVKKMVKRDKSKPKPVLEAPDPTSAPLGMLPPLPKAGADANEEGSDIDIFEGAGTEYNPLAGLQDDSSSSEEEGEESSSKKLKPSNDENIPPSASPHPTSTSPPLTSTSSTPMPPPPPRPKTNYFDEPTTTPSRDVTYQPPTAATLLSDPTLAAALAKASTLKPLSASSSTAATEKAKRHAALLESADRDAFDIDFGFGGSRDFGDEDEDDGYLEKKGGGGAKKRKRGGGGPKVKKGDKNDAGVVGKIVEERYGKGK